MNKFQWGLLFLLFWGNQFLLAQECPGPLEMTAVDVKKIVESAPGKMKSVDEFLASLPKTMTSNFIFMGESRSFQNGTKENPRVILTSPKADVRISFNTDPSQRGYNNVEISIWDPVNKKFDYQELSFDDEAKKPGKKHGDTACTTCHGNPPKPNWDTYNYWAGAIPFNKDTLVNGSAEVEWYLNLIRKTTLKDEKTNKSRLRFLTPIEDQMTIETSMKSPGYLMRLYMSDNGPTPGNAGGVGTQMFDMLQPKQRCAEAKQMTKDPAYPRFKYLLAGMMEGCSANEMVPAWYSKVATDYFYGAIDGFTAAKSGEDLYQTTLSKVVEDTDKQQLAVRKDKDNRQRYFFEKQLGSKEAADKEMNLTIKKIGLNAIGIQPGSFRENIGENSSEVGKLRYFLEPLGANISRFSTSIDPNTYSFADLFRSDYMLPEDKIKIDEDIKKKGLDKIDRCEALAKLSKEALSDQVVMEDITKNALAICNRRVELDKGVIELSKLAESTIEIKVQNILDQNCVSCHKAQTYSQLDYSVGGAQVIPFDDIQLLKFQMNSPQGKLTNLAERIQSRITRPHDYPGAMPLVGVAAEMSKEDTVFLNAWLSQFTSKTVTTEGK